MQIHETSFIWTEDKGLRDRRSYVRILGSCENKIWKKKMRLEFNGVVMFDLCDTGAVPYKLNYHTRLSPRSRLWQVYCQT